MATKGGTSIKGSIIVYDFVCTRCGEKGRNVEAIKRCEDCNEDMCEDCLDDHNSFKAMRKHSLLDKKEVGKPRQDGGRPDIPKVKCDKHPGNRVELYCKKHDDVGCATCGNVDHKLCKDVHYVTDVAVGIKATTEPSDVADCLGSLVNRTARVKQARENTLRRVTTERDTAVQSIEQRVDAIKQRLDDLKVAAIAEVDVKFRGLEKTVTRDINKSDDLISQLEKEERRLKEAHNVGETDLFVYVKQARVGMRDGEKVLQELEKSRGESLNVVIDDTVLACVTGLETFVNTAAELSFSIDDTPIIRMKEDQNKCLITDCCYLDNGTMLLTDENNRCVKLFSTSYRTLDRCVVQGEPTAACVVGAGEVAIALGFTKTIQFAAVDNKIRLTRSFSISDPCRGASFSNNRLILSCGGGWGSGGGWVGESYGQVRIYDTSGDLLQTIKHDILDVPYHSISTRNDGFIVANMSRGILAFDIGGKLEWRCQPAELKDSTGLCIVDDRLLVCCRNNGHVLQVNPADQSSRILLRGSDELKKPRSLTYDIRNDQLIVTSSPCDQMFVYKITRK